MKRCAEHHESAGEERRKSGAGGAGGADAPRYACRRCGLCVDVSALGAAVVCPACLERTFYKCASAQPVLYATLTPASSAPDSRQRLARPVP